MADSKSITLNPFELSALADRLFSRRISDFSTATTKQSRDLRLASPFARSCTN
jgi:hypothetical protein